ncbi:MAG: FmdB family zinc ribbon protein [Acidobacteriota bacterium]
MPLYEYQCQECGTKIEELQRIADPPLTECSVCGGLLKRLISSPAVQFKGSGWYVTDYAGKTKGSASGDVASVGSGDSKDSGSGASASSSDASSGGESSSSSSGDGSSKGSESKSTASSGASSS